jgi:hypothetical protein
VRFLVQQHLPQAPFAFLVGSSMAGIGTERVKDLREVFMTLSEDQLKGLRVLQVTFTMHTILYICMYVCMYKGWATKTSPCTVTFEDLLCLFST